jgi:Arc/MetJ-type ribon-helix-helix transcriptional regulator
MTSQGQTCVDTPILDTLRLLFMVQRRRVPPRDDLRRTFWFQEGLYTNRTDIIRTAIRTQLATRGEALDQTMARRTLTLGSCHYARRDLEDIRDTGQMIHIRGWGWGASPLMSLPSWAWPRSPQWRYSAPSVPRQR